MSRVLLDTNVLVGTLVDSHRDPALAILTSLVRQGDQLCIAPQSVYEFWSVATRPPSSNGLGLSPAEAFAQVRKVIDTFTLLPDPADLLSRWLELCLRIGVTGRPSHDARLVAFMIEHDIKRILTFENSRFARFEEVGAISL